MARTRRVSRSVVRFTSPVNLDGKVYEVYEDSTDNLCYQPYGLEIDLGTQTVETYLILPWYKVDNIVEVVTTVENVISD